jgi:hypothetical protein
MISPASPRGASTVETWSPFLPSQNGAAWVVLYDIGTSTRLDRSEEDLAVHNGAGALWCAVTYAGGVLVPHEKY